MCVDDLLNPPKHIIHSSLDPIFESVEANFDHFAWHQTTIRIKNPCGEWPRQRRELKVRWQRMPNPEGTIPSCKACGLAALEIIFQSTSVNFPGARHFLDGNNKNRVLVPKKSRGYAR